jgi:group I intron endonuclease
MKSGIYKITIGRWLYWGSTKNFTRRKSQHLRELKQGKHGNPILQNAYNKHNSFEFEIIANVEAQELIEWEQEIIDVWFGTENCANLSAIVGRPAGTKGKSPPNKGKPSPSKGKPRSEEIKAKISATKKGKPSSFKGKAHSEKTKAKISAARQLHEQQRKITNAETNVE